MLKSTVFEDSRQATFRLMLSPESIAIVGASKDPKHVGGIALNHMVNFGYEGAIYPINPKYDRLFGLACYSSLDDLPCVPDVVVIALGARHVLQTLKDAHKIGVKTAIIYSSGFAEEGGSGIELQNELVSFAQETQMLICGPNCMGLADLNTRAITAFATLFADYPPVQKKGHVSVVTQSGNMCIVLYAAARERGVYFKYFVNTGNEACVDFSEYLDYLATDQDTSVILGYIEGLRNGSRFIEVTKNLRKNDKPLIAIRAGVTDRGSVAARSHTASLAGDQKINQAAFKQLGVMQARDPIHAADLAYMATFSGRPTGSRVAVVSISGAMGALLTDLLIQNGMDVPELSVQAQDEIRIQAPGIGMVSNPVDTTAALYKQEGIARAVFETLSRMGDIDVVLVYATGYLLDRVGDELIEVARNSRKFFLAIDTGKATCRDQLEAAGIPVFSDIARATDALSVFSAWCVTKDKTVRWDDLRQLAKREQPGELQHIDGRLDEHEIKNLLRKFDVPVTKEMVVTSVHSAATAADSLGYPVVLKILSPDILHKTEVGGVEINVKSSKDVVTAYNKIVAHTSKLCPDAEMRGVLIQKMEAGVSELIVGVTRDPVFGLAITVGIGGVLTEVFQDASHRLLPVNEDIASEMLCELRGYPILAGYRGKKKGDIAAACRAIADISSFAMSLGDRVSELEVNPLIIREEGEGVVAVDALIVWSIDEHSS